MDTRAKIISPERAVEVAGGGKAIVLTGYFDVLQAALIQALQGISKGEAAVVVAAVLDPPAALLSARARAELAAGLEVVDYVVPVADDATELIRAIQPCETIHQELADRRRSAELIQHVQQKHKS